jgi:hypothetical protein
MDKSKRKWVQEVVQTNYGDRCCQVIFAGSLNSRLKKTEIAASAKIKPITEDLEQINGLVTEAMQFSCWV